jgi:ribonuclease P protein component
LTVQPLSSEPLGGGQDCSFPKAVRLRVRRQFLRTQREGARYTSESFFAYIKPTKSQRVKLGITASKKVGKAHDRNRYKRLAREAFRLSELRQLSGYDLVLVIRQESPPQGLSTLLLELERLTAQLKEGRFASATAKPRSKKSRSSKHNKRGAPPAELRARDRGAR